MPIQNCLLTGLLVLPLLAAAQEAPPRFFAEVGASALTYYKSPRPTLFFTGNLLGPALTVGTRLTPRLGAQVGAAYAWRGHTTEFPASGSSAGSTSAVQLHTLSLPMLLRYEFLPTSRRWHLSGLGGFTLRYSWEQYTYSFSSQGRPVVSESVDKAFGAALTLGPALRYSLTSRLDLSAETLLSAELTTYDFNSFGIPEYLPTYTLGDRLFWNFRAGVRYNFGR